MHCSESLSFPLDLMHQKLEKGRFKKHIPEGPLGLKAPGTNPWDIIRCISEFSRRDLSYPEDRINAMRGIFHAFEKGPEPLYNIMGIPILTSHAGPVWNKLDEFHNRILPWGFLTGLTWSLSEPSSTRVAQFPSWSWASRLGQVSRTLGFKPDCEFKVSRLRAWMSGDTGMISVLRYERWKGKLKSSEAFVEMDGKLFGAVPDIETFTNTYKIFDAKVWVEGDDKELTPFPSLEAFKDVKIRDLFTNQRFIYLKAFTISCYPVDIVQERGKHCLKVVMTESLEKKLDRSICIIIGKPRGENDDFTGHEFGENWPVLIVEELDGYAERVGIASDLAWIDLSSLPGRGEEQEGAHQPKENTSLSENDVGVF
ncbi:hypothetical protein ACEPPN_002845 [Leptodophora sp. 'Broadleaf-Isolate-01']